MMVHDEVLFSDPRVLITKTRAVFDGTTYPIRNITSVRSWSEKRSAMPLAIGIVLCLFALPILLASAWLGAGLFVAGAWLVYRYVMGHDAHHVRIGTAGLDSNVLASTDSAYISLVVFKMNDAIARLGQP